MADTLEELQKRLWLANGVIAFLEKNSDDPRAPRALEIYGRQRDEIQRRISALESGDVIVGLKTAKLSAVSSKGA
jgi:hypothetical protein